MRPQQTVETRLQPVPGLSILGEPLGFSGPQVATDRAGINVPVVVGPAQTLQQPDPSSSPFMWTSVHMDTFSGPCQPHKDSLAWEMKV